MSKKKKSKKKNRIVKTKTVNKKKIFISSAVGVAIVVAIALICIASAISASRNASLYDTQWRSVSAKNTSGDEVDIMSEIYEVKYSSYQGSLNFDKDGTFDLWLSPGSPEDGTHSGSFTISDDSTIDVVFDDGTVTSFETIREDGKVVSIVIKYKDCDVYFTE